MQAYARRHDYPQEDYFGLGPASLRRNHANYLIQATTIGARAAVRPERRLGMPAAYVSDPPEYLQVRVSAVHSRFPLWEKPITVQFRRAAGAWSLVGLSRFPD